MSVSVHYTTITLSIYHSGAPRTRSKHHKRYTMDKLKLLAGLTKLIFVLGIIISALSAVLIVLLAVNSEARYSPYLALITTNLIIWATHSLGKYAIKKSSR